MFDPSQLPYLAGHRLSGRTFIEYCPRKPNIFFVPLISQYTLCSYSLRLSSMVSSIHYEFFPYNLCSAVPNIRLVSTVSGLVSAAQVSIFWPHDLFVNYYFRLTTNLKCYII